LLKNIEDIQDKLKKIKDNTETDELNKKLTIELNISTDKLKNNKDKLVKKIENIKNKLDKLKKMKIIQKQMNAKYV